MSAELYRCTLANQRGHVVIARMRDAIRELAEIAQSAGISSLSFSHIRSRVGELRTVGDLTVQDVAGEFGPLPPGLDLERGFPAARMADVLARAARDEGTTVDDLAARWLAELRVLQTRSTPAAGSASTAASVGTYIASRWTHQRSAAWRRLRDEDGWKISSTWIDDPGARVPNPSSPWGRIAAEVAGSERLILYVEPDDFPLEGALVEVGIAISHLIPIFIVAPGVVQDPNTLHPIGSWTRHPLVTFADRMQEALAGATVSM